MGKIKSVFCIQCGRYTIDGGCACTNWHTLDEKGCLQPHTERQRREIEKLKDQDEKAR